MDKLTVFNGYDLALTLFFNGLRARLKAQFGSK